MKHSKSTKAIALLMSMTMITSVFVGNTLSRYVTSVSSTDSARVAVWGINAGEDTVMNLFSEDYIVAGKTIAASNTNGERIMAPGTSGEAEFEIINFEQNVAPEVAYEVKISLDDSEIDEKIKNNTSVQWKLDNNTWGTWDELKTSILSLSGNAAGRHVYGPGEFATAFQGTQEHKIAWQWLMDNNNNEMDTQMGNLALTNDLNAVIKVSITAQQVDDLITNEYILDGADQTVNLNDIEPITIKSSADFSTFQGVEVNGQPLTRDVDYTAEEGSTVITLNEEYLFNLTVGTYTIDIISNDVTATTKFEITNNIPKEFYSPITSPYTPSNMINYDTLIVDYALTTSSSNNNLEVVSGHSASENINVEPNTTYIMKTNKIGASSFRIKYILNDGTFKFETKQIANTTITIPENCNAFRISGTTENMNSLYMVPEQTTTIAFMGDSITALPYSWAYQVSDYYYLKPWNSSIGGSTMSNFGREGTPSKTRDPMVERYTRLNTAADIVMVAGGTNDWWYSWVHIGEDDDNVSTTFKGALNIVCQGLRDMYGDKPIIFLTPIKRGEDPNHKNSLGDTLEDYANAIIDICAKYDIYVIDLYHNCPLDPSDPEQRSQFFDGSLNLQEGYQNLYNDTTHPNVYGSRVQTKYVIDEMNKILNLNN